MGTKSTIVVTDIDLKPCPFCGGIGVIVCSSIHYPDSTDFYYPTCDNRECIAFVEEQDEQGGVNCEFDTPEEAAKVWNTRA